MPQNDTRTVSRGRGMKRGDHITISDHKGVQVVTVVGFQDGTPDAVLIDDGSGELDTPRFCSFENVLSTDQEGE